MTDAAIAALAAGALSAVSLPIGAALGLSLRPGQRVTAALMAFGAGALLFALTIEIVAHSFEHTGFGSLALGCVLGGVAFELLNQELNSRGGFLRKAATAARHITRLRRKRTETLLDRMAQLRVFRSLPPEEAASIVSMFRQVDIEPGERLCTEGDRAGALFVIDDGQMRVERFGEVVTELEAGEMFGEMELVRDQPRLATVSAATPARLFRLDRADFEALMNISPAIRLTIQDLVLERSKDLQRRELVSEEEAEEWREYAERMVIEESHIPSALELQSTARAHGSSAALGIWLGILLDGIPESLVIGTNTTAFSSLSWALIAGVFMANLPEAMSSSVIMRAQGYSKKRIFTMWSSITVATAVGALLGNVFLGGLSPHAFAVIEGAAAGAMLTMIAETMLPEAYENGGAVVGLSTLAGFLAALFVKSIA